MDAHYDFQIRQQHQQSTFHGPAGQFDSGGMGAFAMGMGRVAMPLVKKYVLPVAKEFGKNLVSSFVPEISNIISGKKRPRKAVADVLKQSANKTIAKATETRGAAAAVATAAGGGSGAPNAASARATGHLLLEKVSKTVTNLQPSFLQSQKTYFEKESREEKSVRYFIENQL